MNSCNPNVAVFRAQHMEQYAVEGALDQTSNRMMSYSLVQTEENHQKKFMLAHVHLMCICITYHISIY